MQNDQTIKADAGKLELTLVPNEIIKEIASIEKYEAETKAGKVPELICKTRKKGHNWYGLFECPYCGKEFEALISNVMQKRQRSCGCAKGKLAIESKGSHGDSNTRLYRTFKHIQDRCNNPNCKEYKWYGARGIKCEFANYVEFRDFALANGYRDDLTCERIDVNGNYSPENITFIPQSLQARNTTKSVNIEYKGLSLCAAEWAEILGINQNTLTKRKRSGWSDKEVIETPRPGKDDIDMSIVPVKIIKAIRDTRLYGINKYGASESWKKVDPKRYRDAAYRHWLAYLEDPHGVDAESGLPHISHLACNIAFLIELDKGVVD